MTSHHNRTKMTIF